MGHVSLRKTNPELVIPSGSLFSQSGLSARRWKNLAIACHTCGMGSNTPQGDWWQGGAESYWRRRIFVFAGVLGSLGLLAWACSAVDSFRPPGQAAASATSAAAQPTASSAAPKSVRTMTVKARPTRQKRASARAHPIGSGCAPGDVVISLLESQRSYQRPAEPQFTIYVVNVGTRTCAFDAGPRSLRLMVESGPVHEWSPADCARGSTSDIVRLSRGVPLVKQVAWNRIRSDPGCPSRASALRGTYTATVTDGATHSQTDVFSLR